MKKILLVLFAAALMMLSSCGTQCADYTPGNTGSGKLMPPIMSSGSGYYYNDPSFQGSRLALKYYDTATGQSIYLCARPECLHDGNEFCNATSSKYTPCGMTMYEGMIYLNVLEWSFETELREYKLLRASPYGTYLSEICTYAKQETAPDGIMTGGAFNPIIHRGKAYLDYELDGDEKVRTLGIAEVDIFTGLSKTILEVSSNGRINSADVCGDRLFSVITVPESEDSYKMIQKLFDYNISTGEMYSEKLPVQFFHDGRAADGKYIMIGSDGYDARLISYDPVTREFTDMDNEMSEFFKSDKGGGRTLEYDGTNFYAVKEILDRVDAYPAAVFSSDFQKLAEFDIPSYQEQPLFSLNILDGTVYVQGYYRVVCCPVKDILSGNIRWETAYVFDREADKELEENADG